MNSTSRPERENTVIVQLSDIHYLGNDKLFGGGTLSGTFKKLRDYLNRAEYYPDAIVVTGDLIHRGSAGNYDDLRATFDALRAEYHTPVLATFGNHDDIDRATKVFPVAQSVQLKTHRIITFDNSAPTITSEQIDWLKQELADHYREGTILAFHHSPLPSPVPSLYERGLKNPDALAEVLRGSDVIQLLTGHYHHVQSGIFKGIPCWTSPALANHQLMNAASNHYGAVEQSGFSVIEFGTHGPLATALWLDDRETVFVSSQ